MKDNPPLLKSLGFMTTLFRISHWDEILVGIILTSFFINLFALTFPIYLLQVYDRVIPNSALDTLLVLSIIAISILFIDFVLNAGRNYITSHIDASFEHKLSLEAFKYLLNAKTLDFENMAAGTYLEHLSSIASIKSFYGGQALGLIFDLIFILVYLLIIAYIGHQIVIAPIIAIIVLSYLIIKYSQQIRNSLKSREKSDQKRINFIVEVLSRIHTVKSLGIETQMQRRYDRLQDQSTFANFELGNKNNKVTISTNAINQFTTLLTLAYGTLLVIDGKLTIGSLAACVLIANRALQPIGRALYLWVQSQAVQLAKEHAMRVTSLPQEGSTNKPEFPKIKGKIEFNDVNFRYPEAEQTLFKDLNFQINPGEIIGISGENGSGKTTLLSLIAGLFEPTSGKILIEDANIQDFNIKTVRNQIAYLPQRGTLFSGTILDNITLFRPEYAEKAKKLANKLNLLDEVTRLPKGYDTIIGKNAVDILPLGLRQRICIVRALVEDPTIILFDEANNGVDLRSDELLKKMLLSYKDYATVVIVSLRPSYLAMTDRRFILTNEGLLLYNEDQADEEDK